MAKVNIPGSGHGNFESAAGNRYWEYTNKEAKKTLNGSDLHYRAQY